MTLLCIACAVQSPVVVIGALSRTGIKRQRSPSIQSSDLLGQQVRQWGRASWSSPYPTHVNKPLICAYTINWLVCLQCRSTFVLCVPLCRVYHVETVSVGCALLALSKHCLNVFVWCVAVGALCESMERGDIVATAASLLAICGSHCFPLQLPILPFVK